MMPRLLRQLALGTALLAAAVFLVFFWSAVALSASDAAAWVIAWLRN